MVDNIVMGTLDSLLESNTNALQRSIASLKRKDGGMGIPSAAERGSRAFLGSWALSLRTVAQIVGAHSWEEFVASCPHISDAMDRATADMIRNSGGRTQRPDWIELFQRPAGKKQKEWGA